MKLRFNLLWIDDRKDAIEPIEEHVRKYLQENGYELNVIYRSNGKSIRRIFKNNAIDLVAMDYNLGKRHGDTLLKIIKSEDRYIEAVLYSQDAIKLKDKAQDLEGIYRAHRSEMKRVIQGLVERSIKKSMDLHVFRGLVIAEAIDIENQIDLIVQKTFKGKGKHFRDEIIEKHFLDFGKKHAMLCSILAKTTKDGANPSLKILYEKFKALNKEVLDRRNILAHSEVSHRSNGEPYLKGLNKQTKEAPLNEDWKKETRKKLLEHSNNLNEIKNYF